MIFPLQTESLKSSDVSHVPFQPGGTEDTDELEKLWRSGQIPVSNTPIMMFSASSEVAKRGDISVRPKNWGVCVVWRWEILSGVTERMEDGFFIDSRIHKPFQTNI